MSEEVNRQLSIIIIIFVSLLIENFNNKDDCLIAKPEPSQGSLDPDLSQKWPQHIMALGSRLSFLLVPWLGAAVPIFLYRFRYLKTAYYISSILGVDSNQYKEQNGFAQR